MASGKHDWRKMSIDYQQEICENFGGVSFWDAFEQNEVDILHDKTKVLLFGPSTDSKSDKEEAFINKICETIIKEGTCILEGTSRRVIYMVFIFVVGTEDGKHITSWPVFKVPKNSKGVDAMFIDINCRVYKDWVDFLHNNKLPALEYCYPVNGNYHMVNGKVAVEFGKAPQAKMTKKVLNALDVTSTGVSVLSTCVTIASLFTPVAGPLLAASLVAAGGVSAYTSVRSTTTLYDRKAHKQSIGLQNSEARGCYLSIAGSAVGIGATAATCATVKAAQSGRFVGEYATKAVTALNGGALALNGVGMINGVHQLYEKGKDGQLSALDVAQFSASLLLFCHSAVNFQTARSIIEKSQNSVINSYENSLDGRWKRIMFRAGVKSTETILGKSTGRSFVIRNINRINHVDDYFSLFCQDNEFFKSDGLFVTMIINIGQMYGFNYLDSILSVHEKFQLSEILRRFIDPFKKIIMKLCDYLFHSAKHVLGFDFVNIAHFVSELIHHMITLVFRGERFFALSLIAQGIRQVPSTQMNSFEFCLAVLEQIVRNPSSVLTLYKHVQSFFLILLERSRNPENDRVKVDFVQLFSKCSILLKMDKPHWEVIIDFSISVFNSLNLKKFSSLVTIVKEVCLLIQKSVLDMQKKYKLYERGSTSRDISREDYESQIQVNYDRAINTLFEEPQHQSFVEDIREQNLDLVSERRSFLNGNQVEYSEENPLILSKCFWRREGNALLTQEEIQDVCKLTLNVDSLPSDLPISEDNLQICVDCGNSIVIITCDLENERILSYSLLLS